MVVCVKCGQQNPAGSTFCSGCDQFLEWYGEAVDGLAAVPAAANAPQQDVVAILSREDEVVAPGSQVAYTLEVRNHGRTVDHVSIDVVGDPAGWAEVKPASLNLMPGTSDTTTIRLLPPRNAAVRAGRVQFGVRVRSAEHPDELILERGVIEIAPYADTELELSPRISTCHVHDSVTIRAKNNGNVPISLALTGTDPENALGFMFRPTSLQVEPGTTGLATARVSAGRAFLFGSRRTYPFQLVATAPDGPEHVLDGTLQQVSLLPGWIPPALAIAVVAIGAFLFAGARLPPPPTPTPTAAIVTFAPPTTPPPSVTPPPDGPVTPPPVTPPPVEPVVLPADCAPRYSPVYPIRVAGTSATVANIGVVRVGTHAVAGAVPGYDRVTFQFDGDGIPELAMDVAAPPFYTDASGEPLVVPGTWFVRMSLSYATDAAAYAPPFTKTVSYPALAALVSGGDFESTATWFAGFSGPVCYKVQRLPNPERLVIDFAWP